MIITIGLKLKKCSFCKKNDVYARVERSHNGFEEMNTFIECGKCGARGPLVNVSSKEKQQYADIKKSAAKAAKLWNRE